MSQTYTIDDILAVRDKFRDLPYPGFSLMEICRQKAGSRATKLVRGANAWAPQMPSTRDQMIRKLVQGTLNKLAPEKYDEVSESLKASHIVEEESLRVLVPLIFEKALKEPGYAKIYARLCYDLATFELEAKRDTSPETKRRSRFRELIVTEAQSEFTSALPEDLTDEESIDAFAARKKANIKFVGQLFLFRVLSSTTMHRIIEGILNPPQPNPTAPKYPKEIDVEVLTELIENIGKMMDSSEEGSTRMDIHYRRLRELLHVNETLRIYSPRIRFKIMGTLELRANNWVPRVSKAYELTPATLKDREKQMSPTARRAPARFPDHPPPVSYAASSAANWRAFSGRLNSPTMTTPSGTTQDVALRARGAASPELRKNSQKAFEERCEAVMREWLESDGQSPLRGWAERFKNVTSLSDESLRDAITKHLLLHSCLTTKMGVQLEVCRFFVMGLEIEPSELTPKFGDLLRKAVVDDLAEDTPRFYERLATIIFLCNPEATVAATYSDACKTIVHAYCGLEKEDREEAVSELLKLWNSLPAEPIETSAVVAMIEANVGQPGCAQLLAAIIFNLQKRGVIPQGALADWVASVPPDGPARLFVDELNRENVL